MNKDEFLEMLKECINDNLIQFEVCHSNSRRLEHIILVKIGDEELYATVEG